MSKARVIGNLGQSRYRLQVEYDTSSLDAVIDALQQQLADLVQPILDAEQMALDVRSERTALAQEVDQAINTAIHEGRPVTGDDVLGPLKALAKINARIIQADAELSGLKAKRMTLATRRTRLQQNRDTLNNRVVDAYTADYTVDAPLSVNDTAALALVPGEIGFADGITVLPTQHPDGFGTGYDRPRDGQLVPVYNMTPAGSFYNYAMKPGWQRWMPTFRYATVTALDTVSNTCSLDMGSLRSTVRRRDIGGFFPAMPGQQDVQSFHGVPIRYMSCNALAFEIGDEVLVRFKSTTTGERVDRATVGLAAWVPANMEVIGFLRNPRPCEVFYAAGFNNPINGIETVSGIGTAPPVILMSTGTAGDDWDLTAEFTASETYDFLEDFDGISLTASVAATQTSRAMRDTTGPEFWSSYRETEISESRVVMTTPTGTVITHDMTAFASTDATNPTAGSLNHWGHRFIHRRLLSATADCGIYFAQAFEARVALNDDPIQNTPGWGFLNPVNPRKIYDIVGLDGVEYLIEEHDYTHLAPTAFAAGARVWQQASGGVSAGSTAVDFKNLKFVNSVPTSVSDHEYGAGFGLPDFNFIPNFQFAKWRLAGDAPITLSPAQRTALIAARAGSLPVFTLTL